MMTLPANERQGAQVWQPFLSISGSVRLSVVSGRDLLPDRKTGHSLVSGSG